MAICNVDAKRWLVAFVWLKGNGRAGWTVCGSHIGPKGVKNQEDDGIKLET